MAVLVIVEALVKPDSVEAMKDLLKARLHETRSFEGCQSITTYQNADNERTFIFVEQWNSRDDYQKYFAWRTETGLIALLMSLIEGEPSIRYFDALDA